MSAREEVLARIRTALADGGGQAGAGHGPGSAGHGPARTAPGRALASRSGPRAAVIRISCLTCCPSA